jgi:SAM-dependent MidA family methyltransferase
MAKAAPEVSEDISAALKRLTAGGHTGMGALFKVLGVSSPNLASLPGFSDAQPAGDS